jgi:hypothetical protein
MRKVLAVFAALAVAAGVVVFWQPIAAAGDAVAPVAHHPITRGMPGQRQAAGFAIRQADTVVPNLAANALPNGYGPTDLRTAAL